MEVKVESQRAVHLYASNRMNQHNGPLVILTKRSLWRGSPDQWRCDSLQTALGEIDELARACAALQARAAALGDGLRQVDELRRREWAAEAPVPVAAEAEAEARVAAAAAAAAEAVVFLDEEEQEEPQEEEQVMPARMSEEEAKRAWLARMEAGWRRGAVKRDVTELQGVVKPTGSRFGI